MVPYSQFVERGFCFEKSCCAKEVYDWSKKEVLLLLLLLVVIKLLLKSTWHVVWIFFVMNSRSKNAASAVLFIREYSSLIESISVMKYYCKSSGDDWFEVMSLSVLQYVRVRNGGCKFTKRLSCQSDISASRTLWQFFSFEVEKWSPITHWLV